MGLHRLPVQCYLMFAWLLLSLWVVKICLSGAQKSTVKAQPCPFKLRVAAVQSGGEKDVQYSLFNVMP